MALYITGIVIFFAAHTYSAFRSRAPGKDIKEKMGEGPYMGLYSLVSAIGLGLIIYGYLRAEPSGWLYAGPAWGRTAAIVLMALAFILLVAAYVPGTHIKKIVRHPMLSAVILWSIAHLLIGGGQKKLLLFGSFLAFALVDFIAASARGETANGEASLTNDFIAIAIGGGVFAVTLFWAHEALFGIAPIA